MNTRFAMASSATIDVCLKSHGSSPSVVNTDEMNYNIFRENVVIEEKHVHCRSSLINHPAGALRPTPPMQVSDKILAPLRRAMVLTRVGSPWAWKESSTRSACNGPTKNASRATLHDSEASPLVLKDPADGDPQRSVLASDADDTGQHRARV